MQSKRCHTLLLGGTILAFTLAVSAVGFWKYANYRYGGMDLAIYTNVLSNLSEEENGKIVSSLPTGRGGDASSVALAKEERGWGNWYSSIQGSSYLGDHVEPILLLLIPFFRLWPDPRLLLILQALAIGLTAVPLFFLLRNSVRERWAMVLTTLWLFNPLLWNAALFEFHALAFAPFFLLSAAYFYGQRRFWPFLFFLFFSLSVREDIALIVAMFGAIAAVDWRYQRRRSGASAVRDVARPHDSAKESRQLPETQRGETQTGAERREAEFGRGIPHASEVQRPTPERLVRRATPERELTRSAMWTLTPLLLSLLWFFLATRIAAAHSPSGAYKFLVYYGWLRDAASHPLVLLHHFLSIGNLDMALGLLLPFLFLPLLRPRWLLLTLPPLLQILIAEPGGSNVVVELHYGLLFLPALALASIEAIQTFSPPLSEGERRVLRSFSEGGEGVRLWGWLARRFPLPKSFAIGLGLTTYLAAAWLLGPFLGIANAAIRGASTDERTRAAAYDDLLAHVPPDAPIAAGYAALPHIATRSGAYALPYAYLGVNQYAFAPYELPSDLRYLLLDQHDALTYAVQFPSVRWSAPYAAEGPARLQKIIADGRFGIVAERDGVMLLERNVFPEQAKRGSAKGGCASGAEGPFCVIDPRYFAPNHPVRGRLIIDSLRDIVLRADGE